MPSLNFNANETKPEMGFSPLPEGTYRAAIVDSEQKENKKQNGHYIRLDIQVTEGEHKGRKLSTFLNLDHPNAQVVTMARGELSCICHAIGVMNPGATEDLHNIEFDIFVKVVKDKNTGDLQNAIKKYSKASDVASSAPASNPFG